MIDGTGLVQFVLGYMLLCYIYIVQCIWQMWKQTVLEFSPGSREFDSGMAEQENFINQFLIHNSKTLELPYSWSRIKAKKSSSPTALQATVYIC